MLEKLDALPKMRQFDAFPKTQALYQKRSSKGGLWTLVAYAALAVLFLVELRSFWGKEHVYDFVVDDAVHHDMQVNLDVTVAMPCQFLSVDVRDAVGDLLHVSDQEFRRDGTTFELGQAGRLDSLPVKELLSSARAKALNDAGGLLFHNPSKKRLRKEFGTKRFAKTKHRVDNGPACRIYGSMVVKKVTGNLHITTLGHGYLFSPTHTDHDSTSPNFRMPVDPKWLTSSAEMNLSHVFHDLSFGPYFPNIAQPLEAIQEVTSQHFRSYQYFTTIVPTIYYNTWGHSLRTNQYSVTDYARTVKHGMGVPGIFIKYEIDPMTMVVREHGASVTGFLVRLAAILGGAWVCLNMAYRVTMRMEQVAHKIAEAREDGGLATASGGQYSSPASLGLGARVRDWGATTHNRSDSVMQKLHAEEGRPF